MDENVMLKWFVNLNKTLSQDHENFLSDDYAFVYNWLTDNMTESHAYVIGAFQSDEATNECEIKSMSGDFFNGLLVSADEINLVNNVTFVLTLSADEEYQYIFTKDYLKGKMKYIEDDYFYISLFAHAMPIAFFQNLGIECKIKVVYNTCDTEINDNREQEANFWPVYTVCNPKYKNWLLNRTFMVSMEGDWFTINRSMAHF